MKCWLRLGTRRNKKTPNGIFKKDWLPAHGTKTTLAFLDAHIPKNFIEKYILFQKAVISTHLISNLLTMIHQSFDNLLCKFINVWDGLDEYLRRNVNSVIPHFKDYIKSNGWKFEQIVSITLFDAFYFLCK